MATSFDPSASRRLLAASGAEALSVVGLAAEAVRAGVAWQPGTDDLRFDHDRFEWRASWRSELWSITAVREHFTWVLDHDADPRRDALIGLVNAARRCLGLGALCAHEVRGVVEREEPELVARMRLDWNESDGGRLMAEAIRQGARFFRADHEQSCEWSFDREDPRAPYVYSWRTTDGAERGEERYDGLALRAHFSRDLQMADARLVAPDHRDLDEAYRVLGVESARDWRLRELRAVEA